MTEAEAKKEIDETVDWFAKEMKAKLYANIHKGGWKKERKDVLVARMFEEASELAREMATPILDPQEIASEAADVANFAMFIADAARAARLKGATA